MRDMKMEKIRFNDFERGYTDAEKEMRYNPKFNAIFHDINRTYIGFGIHYFQEESKGILLGIIFLNIQCIDHVMLFNF